MARRRRSWQNLYGFLNKQRNAVIRKKKYGYSIDMVYKGTRHLVRLELYPDGFARSITKVFADHPYSFTTYFTSDTLEIVDKNAYRRWVAAREAVKRNG